MNAKKPDKERAAHLRQQAATKNHLRNKAYLQVESLSTLEMLIGRLLLFGNKSQKVFWPLLDATLRQYVDLRLASQGVSDKPESTNSPRPE